MAIKNARFSGSYTTVAKCPPTTVHEYAFIGRSNVGKSSLINMLTGNKGLAKTSAMPGKTMLINRFEVNDGEWAIVDLPGYGYARRGKESREELQKMIEGYVTRRKQMTQLFVLIDSRHEPQRIDLEFMRFLAMNEVPFAIVFTKLDKSGVNAGRSKVGAYCQKLLEEWEELPPVFATSSVDRRGRDELIAYIEELNALPTLSPEDVQV